jgi:hypothetical protein
MEIIENSPKTNERIFLLCDQCFWTVTCLSKKYLDELTDVSDTEFSCPSCKQDELSSFPLTQNNSFKYKYSNERGLEIKFEI